jgi:xanthine dehydrogenase accessory factor
LRQDFRLEEDIAIFILIAIGDCDMGILRRCAELLEGGTDLTLVTVVKASRGTPGKEGFKMILTDQNQLFGTVGGGAIEHRAVEDAKEVLSARQNRLETYDLEKIGMKCGGQVTLLYEYMQGQRGFMLFGGGHINRALTPILESLGFRVTVFDSRAEVRDILGENTRRKIIIGEYGDIGPAVEILQGCDCCFVATHGHLHDFQVLKQVLQAKAEYRYIGLIGSRSKIRTTLEKLAAEGLEAPEYLYAPVGLKIGGDTPAEIAVSIAAEVVAVLNGARAEHMRSDTPTSH